MSDAAHGDLRKLLIYLPASFACGALVSPVVYNLGKAVDEMTRGKRVNFVVDRLAGLFREAGFGEFFQAAVVGCLVLGFIPFSAWLGGGSRRSAGWVEGQPLVADARGWRRSLAGFAVATAVFWSIAWLLTAAGSFVWHREGGGMVSLLLGALPVALFSAVAIEVLFRGDGVGDLFAGGIARGGHRRERGAVRVGAFPAAGARGGACGLA